MLDSIVKGITNNGETNKRARLLLISEKLQEHLEENDFHCFLGQEDKPAEDYRITMYISYTQGVSGEFILKMAIRFSAGAKGIRELDRRLARIPELTVIELKKQGIEKAGFVILERARRPNLGFKDRSGDLRRSIRLGKAKSSKFGVQIPIIAGRDFPAPGSYAGFQEFGTVKFLPNDFLRPALLAAGAEAQGVLAQELQKLIQRYKL